MDVTRKEVFREFWGKKLKLMEIFKPLKEEKNYFKILVEKKGKKKKTCTAG